MANLEKINFGAYGYQEWLIGKINGMKKALEAGESFEHAESQEMLKRKLASYEKALRETE
ncbi:hypothetical protein K9M09_02280 [Patescibacteria group bacterium]|nr:hypothetical protein [Patescibacteria group bacterium]